MPYPRVFISTSSFGRVDPEPLNRLKASGVTFEMNPLRRTLTAEEMKRFLSAVDGLIAGTEPLNQEVLAQAKRLKVISRCGVGLDSIDLNVTSQRRIAVTTTTDAHAQAVAELTVGAMLSLLRQIPQNDEAVRQGKWEKSAGLLLHSRTVGIVGLGKVGKAVVRLLQPFDVNVLACDPLRDLAFSKRFNVRYTTLDQLLSQADIVSLHLPYHPHVHHVLNRERLETMRSGAYVINTSRGGLIDEEALADFLRSGHLAGAFIDTFEKEPYHGPLIELSNVILSPHIGAYAQETRLAMELEAVENLLKHLQGDDEQ